jgi:hypothetical protein
VGEGTLISLSNTSTIQKAQEIQEG